MVRPAMRIEGDAEGIISLQMDLMSGQLKVMSEQLNALSETGEEDDYHASPIQDLRWNREKE